MRFGLIVLCALGAATPPAQAQMTWPLYAMDTGLRGPDVPNLESKVKLLKKLGYAGIGYTYNPAELPRLLKLLDEHGLELSAVYLSPFVEDAPDKTLHESIKLIGKRSTRIELAFRSRKHKPSDPAGDAAALKYLETVSDWAGANGPVVSVYPHRGFWAERCEDGVRLARKIERKNVGTHFNLVHWKWQPERQPLDKLLNEALPHLKCVTINGLEGDRIVALSDGDFDIGNAIATLAKVGYQGPVGLQAYGVPGPSAEHLAKSMQRWRSLAPVVAR